MNEDLVITFVFLRHGHKAYANGKGGRLGPNLDPPLLKGALMPNIALARIYTGIETAIGEIGEDNFPEIEWYTSPFQRAVQTTSALASLSAKPKTYKINLLASEYLGNQKAVIATTSLAANFSPETARYLTAASLSVGPKIYPTAINYLRNETPVKFYRRVGISVSDVIRLACESGKCIVTITHGYYISLAAEIVKSLFGELLKIEDVKVICNNRKIGYPDELCGFAVAARISTTASKADLSIVKIA